MTPHDAYSITIHVCTVTLSDIIHKKRGKTLLSNDQDNKENMATIKLWQTFLCDLIITVNNKFKNSQSVKLHSRKWRG